MKYKYSLILVLLMISSISFAQDENWAVKAIGNRGDLLPVKAFFEDGTSANVVAILKDGADHFMDVKVIHGDAVLPVKMLVSNDYYVPVKAITDRGSIVKIKAVADNGQLLDVKGVSRAGNTVIMAAITEDESFYPIKAVSPEGKTRDVLGVKFSAENIEMVYKEINVLAHVKAVPVIKIENVKSVWFVKAIDGNGDDMDIVATNSKGAEYPVRAIMIGKSAQILNVKAKASDEVDIKIVKENDVLTVLAIDDYGRKMEVKAKDKDGAYYRIVAGELKGNIISIKALDQNGKLYPVKAFSSEGDVYDVKGVKVLKSDVEGVIQGLKEKINYYAHIKALPPIE